MDEDTQKNAKKKKGRSSGTVRKTKSPRTMDDGDDDTIDFPKKCGKKSNASKKKSRGGFARKTVSSNLKEEKVWNTEDEDNDDDNDSDQGIKFDSTSEVSVLTGSDKIRRSSRSSRIVTYTDIDDDAINAALVEEQNEIPSKQQGKKRKMV